MVSLTGCICMQTYLKLFLILSVGWYLLYIYLGVIRVYVCASAFITVPVATLQWSTQSL